MVCVCVCIGANSAPQELPTMKTPQRKRAYKRFPIAEKLVDFPALHIHYIPCEHT